MFRWIMLSVAALIGGAVVLADSSTADARPWGYRGGGVRFYGGYGGVNVGIGRGYYPRRYYNYPYRYYRPYRYYNNYPGYYYYRW